MTALPGDDIFSFHPDADFHGCLPYHVDTGLDGEKVADVYGVVEIHAVDGGGDHGAARVFDRHHAGRIIDIFHNHAAMGNAGKVCILGLHDVSQDDTAVIDCFSVHK